MEHVRPTRNADVELQPPVVAFQYAKYVTTLTPRPASVQDTSVAGSHFITTLSNPCFRTFQNQDGSDSPLNV